MERAPAVATFVCIVAAVVVWGAPLAWADVVPPPPPTTTSEDPPPDPYKAPVNTKKPKPAAPRRVAPVSRPAVVSPVRSYTPASVPVTPNPVVRAPQVKPKRHGKAVRKHRAKQSRHVVPISVAPVSHVVEATRIPVPVAGDAGQPYLWLSGISFAVLAVAGFGLLVLTQRTFRMEWE